MILENSFLSVEENVIIKSKKISVLGLGGLGSSSASMLVRFGVENLIIIDYDCFDNTNLDRQIYANVDTFNLKKSVIAERELKKINPLLKLKVFDEKFEKYNAKRILDKSDIVLDGFDNIESRIIAIETCKELNIPFVFASVAGMLGYVSVITDYTKDNVVTIIENMLKKNNMTNTKTYSFSVLAVASFQVSECIKFILNKGNIITNKLLIIDLLKSRVQVLSM